MSGDFILEKLQDRLDCKLGPQRHLLRLLVIERLKKQPSPHIIADSDDCSASAASAAVFNTPELLESILSHLSMKNLFVASRVAKGFHRLIETSPALQRKLFLLPGKGQPKWQLVQNDAEQSYAMVASSDKDVSDPSSTKASAHRNPKIVARINPLLGPQTPGDEYLYIDDRLQPLRNLPSVLLHKLILESNARPHMYLTDPPCTCAHVDVDYYDALRDSDVLRIRRRVYDPVGVTFGAIHEALHAKGPVAVYPGREKAWYGEELYISPETTIRQQLEFQERDGYHLVLTERASFVQFCHLAFPLEAEFEEMGRTGRVKGSPPFELDESEW